MAVQNQHDMFKAEEVAAHVAALEQQLQAATKEAAQINTRESLLGRAITDYSQVKQLMDMFDPFLQFWTTAAAWKVSLKKMLWRTVEARERAGADITVMRIPRTRH